MIAAMSIVGNGFWAIILIGISTTSPVIFDLPVYFPHTESSHEKVRSGRHEEK